MTQKKQDITRKKNICLNPYRDGMTKRKHHNTATSPNNKHLLKHFEVFPPGGDSTQHSHSMTTPINHNGHSSSTEKQYTNKIKI